MGLTKLGLYIEPSEHRNSEGVYDRTAVVGLSTAKQIIETKANLDGVSMTSYKLLPPRHFAYVPDTSRRGEKMSLGYNTTEETFLVSSISVVFRVSDTANLNSDYLYMYFNRPEFDRYARFNSWGSAREAFSWDDMCDISIDLPPLPVQEKVVAVYNAMLANQRAYESGLEDLNMAIAASIEEFKHTAPRVAVGRLLEEIDTRNRDNAISNVQGININKEFMPSVANLSTTDLTKYKVIRKNQFAYSAMQTGRDECIRIALFHEDEPVIISPAYSVLQVKAESEYEALAEYIMLWFSRSESDRYGWFISDSSIRASLELARFYEIEIPLPSLEKQQAVVNFYNARHLIMKNITTVGNMLKELCPILIKGSLEEASA
ncbi:restriction endonuclease subunit S [Proteiniclasticum sp. QWL-01]|jgi:type I restriction enzyme S subunit|uniref:restriction endonuclease subunit S n=1 Tax=Proteiniclasticum sp. QWL-01 TaxID=3036945 RepID=UPI00240F364E|nr:restriction endonuclease subunit S [Proteiniclasticum sp. QWL-01]MEA4816911.1 restriction endonuclease subunit S [Lachnospiraceae bacterium]WFF71826.1 restriction endonuclease subunit S [Proteiniclasticum sp. QWL-01]